MSLKKQIKDLEKGITESRKKIEYLTDVLDQQSNMWVYNPSTLWFSNEVKIPFEYRLKSQESWTKGKVLWGRSSSENSGYKVKSGSSHLWSPNIRILKTDYIKYLKNGMVVLNNAISVVDESYCNSYEESSIQAQAQELIDHGYCGISNKFHNISRIDKLAWRTAMAKEHAPWDIQEGYEWVEALGDGAEDFYRRCYSQDKISGIDPTIYSMLPSSNGTVIGYKER